MTSIPFEWTINVPAVLLFILNIVVAVVAYTLKLYIQGVTKSVLDRLEHLEDVTEVMQERAHRRHNENVVRLTRIETMLHVKGLSDHT